MTRRQALNDDPFLVACRFFHLTTKCRNAIDIIYSCIYRYSYIYIQLYIYIYIVNYTYSYIYSYIYKQNTLIYILTCFLHLSNLCKIDTIFQHSLDTTYL